MKRYIIMMLLSFGMFLTSIAQYAFFPTSGTVTFERKFHVVNYMKKNHMNKSDVNTWQQMAYDNILKNGPTEMLTHHTLKFFGDETLFETIKEEYPTNYRNASWYSSMMNDTKTFVNFQSNVFQKLLVFGDDELILKDSVPKVKWKYTDEYRNIAGYDCRRANGLIQDSIYVVAFFSGQIPIPAGPELINGLPGMILGVSIPSLNVNMFATKVELNNNPVSSVLTKKKKVTPESKEEVFKKLKSSVYDYLDEKDFNKQKSKILF